MDKRLSRHKFLVIFCFVGIFAGLPRAASGSPPNDPYVADQWALGKINAAEAWDRPNASGAGINVAVIDSGLDTTHPDLQCPGKTLVVEGSDVVRDGEGVQDVRGHGTHVSGIIGACSNNSIGIAGVAPAVTLLPFQVIGRNGAASWDHVATAITRATDAGAHVINLSLSPTIGPTSYVPNAFASVDQAIAYATGRGALVVAAAGNNSLPLCEYPALARDVICVGATDARDLKAWNSSFPMKLDGTAVGPSLVAPGGSEVVFCDIHSEGILSLYPEDLDDCDDRLGYRVRNGTSMAAAHVSGAAALLYERAGGSRTFSAAGDVTRALLDGAADLGPTGFDPAFGSGRLDALASVDLVVPPAPPQLTVPTSLFATSRSASDIDLSWTDTSTVEDGFRIERAIGAGSFVEIATVGVNVTSYTNTGLTTSNTYRYRIRAAKGAERTVYSNIAGATTRPAIAPSVRPSTPSTVRADGSSPTSINVTWTDTSNNEDGFRIERWKGSGAWVVAGSTGANTTSHNDINLAPGSSFFYRVVAYNAAGVSNPSGDDFGVTNPDVPPAPNLTAIPVSQSEVDLEWEGGGAASSYLLERSTDGVNFTQIASVTPRPWDGPDYTDSGLEWGTNYRYRIRGTNVTGTSPYSNVATARTGEEQPPGWASGSVMGFGHYERPTVFFASFACTATAVGFGAVATHISECYLNDDFVEDVGGPYRGYSTDPVDSSGHFAWTSGHESTGGGTDYFESGVTVCWRVSARFSNGYIEQDEGCT